MWIGRRFAPWLFDGDILLIYIMWYSAERVWLETFRVQNWIILGVPTATWVGVITFVGAGGFLWLRHARGWGVPGAWIKEKGRRRRLPRPRRTVRGRRRKPRRSQALAERGILPDVTAAVGGTPLVALDRLAAGVAPRIVGKLEHMNPGGSVKDRIALPMIEAAERAGLLQPGGVIVEPTSGNTGVGLAMAAAIKGYRCIFVMADKQSEEKRALLRAYGAEVVICPTDVDPDDERSYYRVSDRLARETPGAWKPDQYANPANPEAHYLTTGPEIWEATEGRVTHLVVALGTGGTVSGAGRYLRRAESGRPGGGRGSGGKRLLRGRPQPYLTEGIGEDFWPDTYDTDVCDLVVRVSDRDSMLTARQATAARGS